VLGRLRTFGLVEQVREPGRRGWRLTAAVERYVGADDDLPLASGIDEPLGDA
jgi:hypothetical protein